MAKHHVSCFKSRVQLPLPSFCHLCFFSDFLLFANHKNYVNNSHGYILVVDVLYLTIYNYIPVY